MNWILILAIISGIAIVQGIFLGSNAIARDKKNFDSYFFLGLLLIALSLRIGKSLFYYYWPDMSLIGVIMGAVGLWSIGPSFFLFLKTRNQNISKASLAHYIPALALIISYPFLDMRIMYYVYYGGAVYTAIYLIIAFFGTNAFRDSQLRFISWSLVLIDLMFFYQLYSDSLMSYALGAFLASGFMYIINFQGLDKFHVTRKSPEKKGKIHQEINSELSSIMEDGIYRESKLTLDRLSQKLERPSYQVRNTIHLYHNMKFNDFLNYHRVMEVENELLKESQPYTIEAIARNAGFSSIPSFYAAFKKIRGCTPKEYKKRVREKQIA